AGEAGAAGALEVVRVHDGVAPGPVVVERHGRGRVLRVGLHPVVPHHDVAGTAVVEEVLGVGPAVVGQVVQVAVLHRHVLIGLGALRGAVDVAADAGVLGLADPHRVTGGVATVDLGVDDPQ